MQTETNTASVAPPQRVNFKSSRRTQHKPQAKTLALFEQIESVLREYDRMTVRQCFYQMTTRGFIEKTERGYDRVADATVKMRRSKRLAYGKIVDGGRVRRRLRGWDSIGDLLESSQRQFRLNYWDSQPELVEIWCEKDALGGVITPVTDEYGVTFVALKGFGSLSIAYESGQELRLVEKPIHIYYYGDHDPSGWAVSQAIEAELRDHLGTRLYFTRVGLNPGQIARYGLPTRPPKKGDTRNRAFIEAFGKADCVELDALPPNSLTQWVREAIKQHIDWESWNATRRGEEAQRDSLDHFREMFSSLTEMADDEAAERAALHEYRAFFADLHPVYGGGAGTAE